MKRLLRTQLRKTLRLVTQPELAFQSRNVLSKLLSLDLSRVHKVALYLNFDHSEVQTQLIIEQLFQLDKRVFLPKVLVCEDHEKTYEHQKFRLQFFEVTSYEQVLQLKPQGKFKIREPNSGFDIMDDKQGGFDLIVLPGLAFTKDLYRMGHGAGLYDDFIKRHSLKFQSSQQPYLLGIGLQQQLVPSLSIEDHDEKLNGLIINNQFFGDPSI